MHKEDYFCLRYPYICCYNVVFMYLMTAGSANRNDDKNLDNTNFFDFVNILQHFLN